MKQEIDTSQSLFSRLKQVQSLTRQTKPLGESLISFDIGEVKITFDTLDLLPTLQQLELISKP